MIAPNVRGDRAAIEAAAKLCANAKRPLIFAGDAIAQSNALDEVVAFAELLGAPVYAEVVSSRASFPSSHPLFFGAMVRLQKNIREILAQHDLVISLGADLFTLSLPSPLDAMPKNLKIVHLDTDPWEIAKNYAVEAAIFGEPKVTLPELTAETQARMTPEQRASARSRDQEMRAQNAARARKACGSRGRSCETHADRTTCALGSDRRDAAGRRSRRRRDGFFRNGDALAAAQRRCAKLFWLARRRHRLGFAGCNRRAARAAQSVPSSRSSATAVQCTRSKDCGRPRTRGLQSRS